MRLRIGPSAAVGVATAAVAAAALLALGGGGGPAGPSADPGWSDSGREVYAAMGCGSCHRLAAAGSSGEIGPSLDAALAAHDPASLRRAIVRRQPRGGFSAMPEDYGERMTAAELDALIAFLLAAR